MKKFPRKPLWLLPPLLLLLWAAWTIFRREPPPLVLRVEGVLRWKFSPQDVARWPQNEDIFKYEETAILTVTMRPNYGAIIPIAPMGQPDFRQLPNVVQITGCSPNNIISPGASIKSIAPLDPALPRNFTLTYFPMLPYNTSAISRRIHGGLISSGISSPYRMAKTISIPAVATNIENTALYYPDADTLRELARDGGEVQAIDNSANGVISLASTQKIGDSNLLWQMAVEMGKFTPVADETTSKNSFYYEQGLIEIIATNGQGKPAAVFLATRFANPKDPSGRSIIATPRRFQVCRTFLVISPGDHTTVFYPEQNSVFLPSLKPAWEKLMGSQDR